MILSSTRRARRPSRRPWTVRTARPAIESLERRWLFDIDEPLGVDGGVAPLEAPPAPYTPPTPTTLTATAVDASGQSLLSWNGSFAFDDRMHLEAAAGDNVYTTRNFANASSNSAYVTGLSQQVGTYRFRVRGESSDAVLGGYSPIAVRTDGSIGLTPQTPKNLTASLVTSGYSELRWEGDYNIGTSSDWAHLEYSCNGSTFSEYGTGTYAGYHVGSIGGLYSGTTWYFRVRVANPSGVYTPYSNVYRLQPAGVTANPLVNNPNADATTADTQSETTQIVFGSTVVAAFNDSGSRTSGDTAHFTGWSRSTDGGATFTDLGALPNSTLGDGGDPVLARDNTSGTIYFSTLSRFAPRRALQVFRSTDGGATFNAPVNGAPGFPNGNLDKEWLTVDNYAGAGQGNVYMAFRDFGTNPGMYFTRSTDGGATWGPSGGFRLDDNRTQGVQVVVAPNHDVYAFWWRAPLTGSQQIVMRRSTDKGVTFGTAVTVATLNTTGTNGDLGLGFRSNAFPSIAVNPVYGYLYVAYNDRNAAGTDRGNVFFTQSTDNGGAWSTPVAVNDDGTTRDQWQPALTVNPAGTKLFVGFMDRRNDSANNLIDAYSAVARVWGTQVYWKTNSRLTTYSFKPLTGVDRFINSTYMGDYDTASSDTSSFYYTWGDNRDNSLTRTTKQANVRSAKPAIPFLAVPQIPANLSVSWNNGANPGSATLRWQGSFSASNPTDLARMEYSTDGFNWSQFGTANAASLSGQISGLNRYTTYYLRVRAENENGTSNYSNVATLQAGIPATPTGFYVDPVNGSGYAYFHWTGSLFNAGTPEWDVMHLEYSSDGTNFTESGTTIAAYSWGQAGGLTPGGHYYFRIRATNSYGSSAYSSVYYA